jgi:L-aspartate oxidase
MYERFPTISGLCREHGLDLARDLLPVAPAAHYCMGGVLTDANGRTTQPGLYAVGEVACTGVHGANRLASNSLLEGLVFGLRLADGLAELEKSVALSAGRVAYEVPVYDDPRYDADLLRTQPTEQQIAQARRQVRQLMWQYVSLRRDQEGLLEARRQLLALRQKLLNADPVPFAQPSAWASWRETVNMFKSAELVIATALQRHESRGSHWRGDYPQADERLTRVHYVLRPMPVHAPATQLFQEVAPHA